MEKEADPVKATRSKLIRWGAHDASKMWIRITPQIAEGMLACNKNFRKLRDKKVREYKRAMLLGNWRYTGEPVHFSNGYLVNGQHRLQAIIDSGVAIKCLVIFGVEGIREMDTGLKRGLNDVLRADGRSYPSILAAALRLIWRYDHRVYDGNVGHYISMAVGNTELLDLLQNCPGIEESCRKGLAANNIITSSVASTCHFLFSQHDPDLADWWADRLADGTDLKAKEPVRIYRNSMIAARSSKASITQKYLFATAIKSWNSTATNREMSNSRFILTGPKAETFPEVHGRQPLFDVEK